MRRLLLEADGGSRGNPGPAGYGAVISDADTGEVLAELAEPLGTVTNNVAEYHGLIAALEEAARIDPAAEVEARLDSKLVVEQMAGRWRIKHADLVPLARRARDAAAGFPHVRYTWVPRARNAHADRLANEAMDAAASGGETSRRAAGRAAERSAPAEPAADDYGSETGWSAPQTRPTRLLLLRHGETALSVERRFAGSRDVELTETGRRQADAAARRLSGRAVDAIVSSPLRRARDGADCAARAFGADVAVLDGLRETDFGEWEGRTFGEVGEKWPDELARWLSDTSVAPPQGESFASVARRVAAAREEILRRYAGRTVLVVSHVTPIKILLQQALLAPGEALYRMHLDVASLSEIHYFADGPCVVRSLNDTAHLIQ